MTLVNKLTITVLSEDNAVHTVFFRNIAQNYEIIVLQILNFDPVLSPLIKVILAVLTFRNDTLQFLLFGKGIELDTVFSINLDTANLPFSDITAFCRSSFLSVSGKSVTCLFS